MEHAIRLLEADDAEALRVLRLEALTNEPEAFGATVEEFSAIPVAALRERLAAADSFVVGGFVNDNLVGMIGFVRTAGSKTQHKGRLWGVYVTPSMRGHGIARQLLDKVLQQARTLPDVSLITLSVASTQFAAFNLYRRAGFREYGIEPRALKEKDTFIDEHLMALEL